MDEPLIIEVAINGAVSKQRNPHVPQSTDEVVASIEACLAAGATVVHAHAGDPVVGTLVDSFCGPRPRLLFSFFIASILY